jgi:hypothetical protein
MKRIFALLTLPVFFTIGLIVTPAVNAQNTVDGGYAEALEDCRDNGSVALECHSKIVDDVPKYNFIEGVVGPVEGLTVSPDIWKRNPRYAQTLLQNSAIGKVNQTIVAMYLNPPANTVAYILDTGQSLGFIPKKTYAQGVGFAGLSPLLPIWKIFRNIAYVLLAFVMVIVGFMVMLRKKIDPKTVVTVQNALPKVIVTLILITFSYAIVGIMIDIMYLIIFLAVSLFKTTGLLPDPAALSKLAGYDSIEKLMSTGGLFSVFNTSFPFLQEGGILDLSADIIGWTWAKAAVAGLGGAFAFLLFPPLGALGLAYVGAPVVIAFIVAVALLFIFLRLFFMFFSAYIQIILSLLFGPIQLLGEALPGSHSFASWIGNLVSNIMVFPISAVMIMLAMMMATIADNSNTAAAIWTPPLATLPGGSVRSISALFSIGLLATIPSIVASIKEAIKTKPFVNAGPGAILGPIGSGAGQLVQLGYQASMIYSPLRHQIQESTAAQRAIEAQKNAEKTLFGQKH